MSTSHPRRPARWTPPCPAELDPIVARALAKDPAQRYQTAVEFRADVERAIAGVPVTRVMPLPPAVGPDSQATSVIGGVDPYATAAMAPPGPPATGAMPPVIPGGAGDPYAAPDPISTGRGDAPQGRGPQGLGIAALVIGLMGAGLWLGLRLLGSTAAETVEVPRPRGPHGRQGRGRAARPWACGSVDRRSRSRTCPRTPSSARTRARVSSSRSAASWTSWSRRARSRSQVPDLIDFSSESDARKALAEAGLTLGKVTEEDSDRPEGTVLRQDPDAYETVDAGSAVNIWVSNAQVEVPNVVGRTEAQARTDLFNQGFEVAYAPEVETTEFAPGTVVDQTPGRGERQEGLPGDPDPGQGARPDADADADAQRARGRWWRGRHGWRAEPRGTPSMGPTMPTTTPACRPPRRRSRRRQATRRHSPGL